MANGQSIPPAVTLANGAAGTKTRIIWWLVGLVQVILFTLGGFALMNTNANTTQLKVLAVKHSEFKSTIKEDIVEIKADLKKVLGYMNPRPRFSRDRHRTNRNNATNNDTNSNRGN